jgi:hypothetical protein
LGSRRQHLFAIGDSARFSAVTMPASFSVALTLWPIRQSRAGRTAFA